jgi:hypothetical protein
MEILTERSLETSWKKDYSSNRISINWDLAYLLQAKGIKWMFSPFPSKSRHHLCLSHLKFLDKVILPSKKKIHSCKPRKQPSYKQYCNSQSHNASSTSRCPRIDFLPHSNTISINSTFGPIDTLPPSRLLSRWWVAVLQTAVIESRDWDISAATLL